MKTALLATLLEEAQISPEELGKRMDISGMTLRRWMKRRPATAIPRFYERGLSDEIIRLWMEGRLTENSEAVKWAMSQGRSLYFDAALKSLGLGGDFLKSASSEDNLMLGLNQIGSNEKHRDQVDASSKQILDYGKINAAWEQRVSLLNKVLKSKKLDSMDKLIAYGALYYLICPFDLIPDSVPVFGLIDDFAILGQAADYYGKRFPKVI